MPDITMCIDSICPLRENCYRFTAEPNDLYQSYFNISPACYHGQFLCEYFIDNEEKE